MRPLYFCYGGGVLSLTSLISCENFLKAADIKREIEDAIAYNNAPECTVVFRADSSFGEFLGNAERTCKVGYETEVQFELNTEDYVFKGFKAVSQADKNESRADCVEFKEISKDIRKGVYKYTIKLLRTVKDISIQPECIAIPAVESYSPVSTERQFANVPISITFNNPIEGSENQDNILAGLQLTMYSTDLSNYFTTPEFDSQNKTLTIRPKNEKEFGDNSLEVFVKNLPNTIIPAVVVSFDANTFLNIDGYQVPLKVESFSVSYKADIDLTPPEEYAFFVSRKKITLENAPTFEDDDKFIIGTTKDRKNRTNGLIYIYGYYNIKSGIKNVIVTEQRTNDSDGTVVTEEPIQTVYTKQSKKMQISSSNTDNFFCIEHQIKQGDENDRNDGAIMLKVVVTSDSGIPSQEKIFTAIKKTVIEINLNNPDDMKFTNDLDFFEKYRNQGAAFQGAAFNETEFKQSLKHIHWGNILNIISPIYDGVWYNPEDITVQYKYTGKEEFETATPLEDDYYKPLFDINLDVDSVSGLEMQFKVSDDLGNSLVFDVTIPSSEDFGYTTRYNVDHDRVFRFYNTLGKNVAAILLIKTSPDGTKTAKEYSVYQKEVTIPLEQNCTYKFSPILEGNIDTLGCFWTEIVEDLVISSVFEPTDVGEVELKNVEGTELPVDFVRSNSAGYLHGTIHLADDSWSKYDAIYTELTTHVKSNNRWEDKKKKLFFEKGRLTATFEVTTSSMYEKGCSFIVYGMKGNTMSTGTECVVPTITPTIYNDNISPGCFYEKFNEDYYKYTITDSHSGPDYGIVSLLSESDNIEVVVKQYRADKSTGFVALIPIWDVINVNPQQSPKTRIVVYDKAGNEGNRLSGGGWLKLLPAIQSIKKAEQENSEEPPKENTWDLSLTPVSYYGDTYLILHDFDVANDSIDYIYTINDSDNAYDTWTEWQNLDDEGNPVEQQGLTVTLPQNKMVKIVRKYGNSSTSNCYCPPYYFYTGQKSSGEYDLLFTNGSSKTSVAIQSDAPVFVHTVATEKPYSECKDWSAEDWEFFKKHIGDKYITFSADEHNPKRYSIPVDQIAENECYVVIAHFADNHVEMSEVMQK